MFLSAKLRGLIRDFGISRMFCNKLKWRFILNSAVGIGKLALKS